MQYLLRALKIDYVNKKDNNGDKKLLVIINLTRS